MPLIVSGLEEVIIATATAQQQEGTNNRYIDLMIDSGAATHVCPPWFATESSTTIDAGKWTTAEDSDKRANQATRIEVCDIKQAIL